MLGTYSIYILIFTILIFIINGISFDEETKCNVMALFAVVYNTLLGYLDIYVFKLAKSYFENNPIEYFFHNHVEYMDSSFNQIIGYAIIAFYFYCCTIPLNMFMCEKSKYKKKIYTRITVISAITGMLIYLIAH